MHKQKAVDIIDNNWNNKSKQQKQCLKRKYRVGNIQNRETKKIKSNKIENGRPEENQKRKERQ